MSNVFFMMMGILIGMLIIALVVFIPEIISWKKSNYDDWLKYVCNQDVPVFTLHEFNKFGGYLDSSNHYIPYIKGHQVALEFVAWNKLYNKLRNKEIVITSAAKHEALEEERRRIIAELRK